MGPISWRMRWWWLNLELAISIGQVREGGGGVGLRVVGALTGRPLTTLLAGPRAGYWPPGSPEGLKSAALGANPPPVLLNSSQLILA